MYFPILRGRQFELLAIRECVQNHVLSNLVIPIIEPVKLSPTYVKTINSFIEAKKSIAIIQNPQVGSFTKDLAKESNSTLHQTVSRQMKEPMVIPAFYVTPSLNIEIPCDAPNKAKIESSIFLCNKIDYISDYERVVGNQTPRYNVIPDKRDFRRRIRPNQIICEDHFSKQPRNIDYLGIKSEFFSSDHLYYADDRYKGFSDYSIVGAEYNDTGFAPYAVAIHIVYFDNQKVLRVAHFVSDSNDDISDPARKFAEAVGKLVKWKQDYSSELNTIGIRELESAYDHEIYPGLGVVKKYSIMHHLELMSRYLDEVKEVNG